MKLIFTLFSLLISTITFGQEFMRLDSISYADLAEGTNSVTTYSYDSEGRLDTVTNHNNEQVDVYINYNELGEYASWEVFEDGINFINYNFIYDDENNLDSVIGKFTDETYLLTLNFDIEVENGNIVNVTLGESYGGYSFLFFDKMISYDEQNRISRIDEFDILYYTGEIEKSWEYTYENGKLFSRTYTDLLYSGNSFKDSMLFTPDGYFEQLTRLSSSGVSLDYDIVYTDNKPFISGEFLSPLDFLNFLFLVFDSEETEELIALQNNELPTQHLLNGDGYLIRGTWNYALFVNNKETPIAAQGISVYPNPSSDFINIDLDAEIEKVDIYDTNGKLAKSVSNTEKIVDIQNLSTGSYFILVETKSEGHFVAQVFKE